MINLNIPQEPKDIKLSIKSLNKQNQNDDSIDWISLNVWFGNQLPKYLWQEWKDELKTKGFTWQKFLKLLKYRTEKIILWSQDELEWEELIKDILDLINGPLSKNILKG